MEAFQKRPRPEDIYAKELFYAIRANTIDVNTCRAATNLDGTSLKDCVMGNCPESTRMIKIVSRDLIVLDSNRSCITINLLANLTDLYRNIFI